MNTSNLPAAYAVDSFHPTSLMSPFAGQVDRNSSSRTSAAKVERMDMDLCSYVIMKSINVIVGIICYEVGQLKYRENVCARDIV